MTPSQPSPTNLSDELDKILNGLEADAIEASIIDDIPILSEYDPVHIKAKAAITAAYAEAINEIIGEDEYSIDPLWAGQRGYWARNELRAEQRQRLQRLLPTNGSDGGAG